MKETVIETPLIGSGSQEEVDNRVKAILDLGTTRGYLTYEELNEKLPDEVVPPDKLDSLLMMIDEMGIRLIDESVMQIVEELTVNAHRLHAVQHGVARSLQHAPTLRRRSPAPERHARG
jgi:hypothetical protein